MKLFYHIFFYSINEDYPESKIEIFLDEITQNYFEMNENKINLLHHKMKIGIQKRKFRRKKENIMKKLK